MKDRESKDEGTHTAFLYFLVRQRLKYPQLNRIVNISLFCLEIAQFLFRVSVKERGKNLVDILTAASHTTGDLASGEVGMPKVKTADRGSETAFLIESG
ncbi:MAG TPA: hypothetical protein VKB38_10940 [Terracidiphilus sp.]|nr:hypothetical protein [Terracidiphilus sp.]